MIRNRGPPTIRVSVLQVRSALSYQHKPQTLEPPADLARLQYWQFAHGLIHLNHLRAHEIRLQGWLSVFEEHSDDLFQIVLQLVQ